ncbi:MAG: phytanoyl-CoA dioxygenase family protein [Hyphomicrobiaceae bacterium]|nr:phytanoyl-CoA dioxygenase family protein [Hyphomicrobiaceae bacterium]
MNADRLKSLLPGIPLVESPLLEQILPSLALDAETARVVRALATDGLAVIRLPDDDIDARAERIKKALLPHFDIAAWRRSGWSRNDGLRLQDAWRTNADVKAIACNRHVLELLGRIYGRRAWPFQTLNFPVGTQQHYHSDSVHFSSIPERFMCGVWVALEDIGPDAGPLVYYPGSHKWPLLYNDAIGVRMTGRTEHVSQGLYEEVWRALVEASGIEPRYFHPKKGDALIWLANLLHGGSRHKNPELTRWSQVTHYYFDDCTYITPMLSDVPIGQLFLRDMTDISTGRVVPNMYVDQRLDELVGPSQQPTGAKLKLPADFDARRYLELNPDVKAAKADPVQHYLNHGMRERRRYR